METTITGQYLDAIEAMAQDKRCAFRKRAQSLQRELRCTTTNIDERLEWIDTSPGDLFETLLRLRVRRKPRQP